jgi:NADPH-dependent curcumin reductase CurA
MTGTNRQFRLKARPAGPFEDSDFELVRTPIPVPDDGEFLVKVTHLSIDPVMRSWMNAGHVTPVDVGAVMRAITIGQVVHSRHPGFAEGDFVHGTSASRSSRCRTEPGSTRSTPRRAGRSRRISASWA